MKSLLILSQWTDYLHADVYHYSISKGFNIAGGFSRMIKTYYMTTGKTEEYEYIQDDGISRKIYFINTSDITPDFLDSLDYILFIKEVEMFSLLEKLPSVKELCLKPFSNLKDHKVNYRTQKIGVKSDSLAWIRSENTVCKELFGFDTHEFAKRCLDLLYVQTPEFRVVDFQRFGGKDPQIQKKIMISPMGVNNYIEKISNPNPYHIDHRYCVFNYDSKEHGHNKELALFPFPIIKAIENNDTKVLNDFNRKKTILIYSGRLKMHGVLDMLKDIMKSLGNNYELHIFPGSFNLPEKYRFPGEEDIRYSGKHSFSILRERIFNDISNVIIHHPFTEEEKGTYLTYADIGLDFCQSRPKNIRSCQGNCKLLEYCYFGIKVVAEENINNSDLVTNGKNGILLKGVGSVDEYVKAIKEMEKRTIDNEYTKSRTIEINNWDIIAENILKDLNN